MLDDGILTSAAPECTRRSIAFIGFAGDSPRPRAIGFIDDEILVRGSETEGKNDVYKLGLHRSDGSQRLKLGKREGDESLWGLRTATRCGQDICALTDVLHELRVVRYTKDGAFVGRAGIDSSYIDKIAFAPSGGAETFITGSASASTKDDYAGIVLLARIKPAPTLHEPPNREPIAGPARGKLRGQPFVSTKVAFDFTFGRWRIQASNENHSSVSTSLLVPPRAGAISLSGAAEPKASANAYLDLKDILDPKERKHGSSDVAGSPREHRIEITRWDVRPYDKQKGGSQERGYASGKMLIDFPYEPKDRPSEDSLVVGEFSDAIVVAREDPDAPPK